MAYPRVFISSTCYDLREIRDVLFGFVDEINYIPVLSDKGDVFYHPDIHTHDSCINEIETCQLFILIIGGRFGGKYKADASKSIVNAEYECAKKLNLPIITFISREVFEDHRLYVSNRKDNPKAYTNIIYPSIEKQENSIKIFEFIDDVRKSDYNNAVFPFEFGREIIKCLKQQWAAMFYEFLRQRKMNKEIERTNKLISDLTLISEKTEEILNKVYTKVDEDNAKDEIAKVDELYNAKKLFIYLIKHFKNFPKLSTDFTNYIEYNTQLNFIEFLISTKDFNKINDSIDNSKSIRTFQSLIYKGDVTNGYLIISGTMTDIEKLELKGIERSYLSYSKISIAERKKLIDSLIDNYSIWI